MTTRRGIPPRPHGGFNTLIERQHRLKQRKHTLYREIKTHTPIHPATVFLLLCIINKWTHTHTQSTKHIETRNDIPEDATPRPAMSSPTQRQSDDMLAQSPRSQDSMQSHGMDGKTPILMFNKQKWLHAYTV
jgi:hypothetical protein